MYAPREHNVVGQFLSHGMHAYNIMPSDALPTLLVRPMQVLYTWSKVSTIWYRAITLIYLRNPNEKGACISGGLKKFAILGLKTLTIVKRFQAQNCELNNGTAVE